MEYAAGTAPDALALVVACHVSFCRDCAEQLAALTEVGAALLETAPPAPLRPGALAQVLSRLDATPVDAQPVTLPSEAASAVPPRVPAAVRDVLTSAQPWGRVLPGIRRVSLPVQAPGWTADLVRLKPGLTIPRHDHTGDEYTLVMAGELGDRDQRFRPGDVCVREPGHTHEQRVIGAHACTALLVRAGDLVPLTWLGKVLKRIARG